MNHIWISGLFNTILLYYKHGDTDFKNKHTLRSPLLWNYILVHPRKYYSIILTISFCGFRIIFLHMCVLNHYPSLDSDIFVFRNSIWIFIIYLCVCMHLCVCEHVCVCIAPIDQIPRSPKHGVTESYEEPHIGTGKLISHL